MANDFMGKVKENWQQRAMESTTFRAELRLVPRQLKRVLFAVYAAALGVLVWLSVSMPNIHLFGIAVEPLPLRLLAVFGALTGIAAGVSFYVMLMVYIGRDASRRGMSPVLWVLVALFVPYLIGVILYFVLRDALPVNCPQCGSKVSAQFTFCPACKFNLRPHCPGCHFPLRVGYRFCPRCGFSLHTDAAIPGAAEAHS